MDRGGNVKKCEYCGPKDANFIIDAFGIYLFIEKNSLVVGYSDMCTFESNESIKVNYCPMCGRKLSDK